jgi:hypothetical protein
MKQLLPIFFFLLPCLAWAQYPSNGNQKITLGEQTTADGLVYRGVAATDTVRKPSIDTMAYMVLDTTTNIIWHYKKATSNAWLRLNLLPSDTASMLTPYWRSGRFSGTLPVANGGTNTSTAFTAGSVVFAGSGGTYTQDNSGLFFNLTDNRLGINNSSPVTALDVTGSQVLRTSSNTVMLSTVMLNTFETTPGIPNNDNLNFRMYGRGAISETLLGNNTLGNAFFYAASNTGTPSLSIGTTTSAPLYFATNNLRRLTINSAGNVGIGTATPQSGYRLHVVDSVYVGGNVSAAAYTTRSDYNLKDDIFDIKYGLNDVLQLQPVEYTYKSNGSKQLGFIAQDIGTILPEVVSFEESMSVNYQAIIPILTKAIQEQQALIKALEQRIINLENK